MNLNVRLECSPYTIDWLLLSQFTCWSPNPLPHHVTVLDGDGVFEEAIRVKWGHRMGSQSNGTGVLIRRERKAKALSLCHVRSQREGGHGQTRERVLTRHRISRHLDLGRPASRTVIKIFYWSIHQICGVLLWWPKLRRSLNENTSWTPSRSVDGDLAWTMRRFSCRWTRRLFPVCCYFSSIGNKPPWLHVPVSGACDFHRTGSPEGRGQRAGTSSLESMWPGYFPQRLPHFMSLLAMHETFLAFLHQII